MAELITKKGRIVNCNILNESTYSYLIEYNGRVGQVRKDGIISLNEIDEAVLEGFGQRAKNLFNKIKNKLVNFFIGKEKVQSNKNSYSDEYDEYDNYEDDELPREPIYQVHASDVSTGKVLPISIPINAAIAAQQTGFRTIVSYDGPESDYEFARKIGYPIDSVPRNNPNDNYASSIISKKTEEIRESLLLKKAPHRSILNEDDGGKQVKEKNARSIAADYKYLPLGMSGTSDEDSSKKDSEQIAKLQKYAKSMTLDEAAREIYVTYRKQSLEPGKIRSSQSICLWGAPGIGKSNIKNKVLKLMEDNGFKGRWVEISGRGVPDDLYMQVKTSISFIDASGEGHERQAISLESICNLPMYNSNGLDKDTEEQYNIYCNGGIYEKVEGSKEPKLTTPDDGGILFIDEFSRSNELMMKVLMTLISDQTLGGGIVLGNKWIVVAAANTKSQMEGLDSADEFFLDPAQQTRLKNIMIEPDFNEWYDYYSKQRTNINYHSKVNKKDYIFNNIEPEILEFIKKNRDWFYKLQIIPRKNSKEFTNQFASKAVPRTWENASLDIRAEIIVYNEEHNTDIRTLTEFWNYYKKGYGYPGREAIQEKLNFAVGVPAQEAFTKYMDSSEGGGFDPNQGRKVWDTGMCDIQNYTDISQVLLTYIPAIVKSNPRFDNEKNAHRLIDLIPVDKLINVYSYLEYLYSNNNDMKRAGNNNLSTLFGNFGNQMMLELAKHDKAKSGILDLYKNMENGTIEDNLKDFVDYIDEQYDLLKNSENPDDKKTAENIIDFIQAYNVIKRKSK